MSSSILGRISEGDQAAVQECIDQYGGLVWSVARRFIRNQAEAEDAVQDVFIDLWKSAGRFNASMASEKSFIVMVARRRIIDRLRRSGRRLDTSSVEDQVHEPASDQHERMEKTVEAVIAAKALGDLSPDRRRVIELSIYTGMSHREISESTGLPIGTVKSHITRGLADVRERLLSRDRGIDGGRS